MTACVGCTLSLPPFLREEGQTHHQVQREAKTLWSFSSGSCKHRAKCAVVLYFEVFLMGAHKGPPEKTLRDSTNGTELLADL